MRNYRNSYWARNFRIDQFFGTLSYREFLSVFALAVALVSFLLLVNFLSNDEKSPTMLLAISFIGCIIALHVFYKIEHRRPNAFTGRYILTCAFLFATQALVRGRALLLDAGQVKTNFEVNDVIPHILESLFWILVIEIAISILKKILDLLRWRIL